MGREKRVRLKRLSRNFRRTYRCSHHHEASYPGRSKSLQQTTDATLITTTKESAWSCETCMHDMAIYDAMQLSKIKRNRNPDTHRYGSSCFTTRQFKCLLAWQNKAKVSYTKIKWSGEPYLVISQVLHMLFIRWDTNYHTMTWCKMQTSIWMAYSNSMHFSDPKTYKILCISSYGWKDMNLAKFAYLQ
jgi:hypothetical protein